MRKNYISPQKKNYINFIFNINFLGTAVQESFHPSPILWDQSAYGRRLWILKHLRNTKTSIFIQRKKVRFWHFEVRHSLQLFTIFENWKSLLHLTRLNTHFLFPIEMTTKMLFLDQFISICMQSIFWKFHFLNFCN